MTFYLPLWEIVIFLCADPCRENKKWLQVYFKGSIISLNEIKISLKEILRQIISCGSGDISQCEYVGSWEGIG